MAAGTYDVRAEFFMWIPMDCMPQPSEVAAATPFLPRDDASYPAWADYALIAGCEKGFSKDIRLCPT